MTFRIRAARDEDLQALYEMAKLTGGGFTNLPPEKDALRAKLVRSHAAFARRGRAVRRPVRAGARECRDRRGARHLPDLHPVGQHWPFYSYRIGTETKHSQELNRTFRAEILSLVNDLEGCERGRRAVPPSRRARRRAGHAARAQPLSVHRRHRARFADRILAELRGVIDEAGGSPFWDGVAGRFFGMNFQEADEFNASMATSSSPI
jgi:arginine N-succinyltransferase